VYATSKAALNRGTVLLSEELKSDGVRVNAVDPGWCRTDLGGPDAPRSATEGALSILYLIESNEDVLGTGKLWSSRGAAMKF
jgi:NAD(P)-dependent dehydrogenase (short-subunit alcohol dehydrogenase family)